MVNGCLGKPRPTLTLCPKMKKRFIWTSGINGLQVDEKLSNKYAFLGTEQPVFKALVW